MLIIKSFSLRLGALVAPLGQPLGWLLIQSSGSGSYSVNSGSGTYSVDSSSDSVDMFCTVDSDTGIILLIE